MIEKTTEAIKQKESEENLEEEIFNPRSELTLNNFMNDMSMLGHQVNNIETKPAFNYGDLSVSNYLLWLILGELMTLNDKSEEL